MGARVTVEDVVARIGERPIELVEYAGKTALLSTFRCLSDGCGHVWKASVNNITHSRNPTGCPKCAPNAKVDEAEVRRRLEGLGILLLRYGGTTNGHSDLRCEECGHEWHVGLNHIFNGTGCPQCANISRAEKHAMPYSEAVDRIRGRGIDLVSYSGRCNDISVFSCHVCGHAWETTLNSISYGTGCPSCAGTIRVTLEDAKSRLVGRNIEIIEYGGKSNARSRFRCTVDGCGYEWETLFTSVDGGSGCQACAGSKPWTSERLEDVLVDKGIQLLNFAGGAHGNSTFQCTDPECGYVWATSIGNLSRSWNCPKCSGSAPVTEEDVRRRLKGRPIELVKYAGKVALHSRFRCTKPECGHEWDVSFNSLDNRGTGCPACAEYGFNPDKPATFYTYRITCRNDTYLGFGITGDFAERSARHQKSFRDHGATGELIFTYDGDGHAIQEIERTAIEQFEITNTGIPGFIREATLYADWKVAVLKSLCAEAEPLAISTQTP